MVKKFLRLLYFISFISLIFGCSNMNNKDQMALMIKNNSDVDFYSVELTWHQDGGGTRVQGVANADGTPMKKGELIPFYFNSSDFIPGKKTMFEIGVFIDPNMNKKIVIDPPVPFFYTHDEQYYLSINGNSPDQLILHLEDQSSVQEKQ